MPLDAIGYETAVEHLDAWSDAEEKLREQCQGCAGVGFYGRDGLPSLEHCKRPELDPLTLGVRWVDCPVQAAFRARVLADRLLGESELPRRFRRRTLDRFEARTPDEREALRAAWALVERVGEPEARGLLIMGRNGTGKTHLAAGILLEVVRRGIAARFYTAPELLDVVRRSIDAGTTRDTLSALSRVPLLIIDDLGKEYIRPPEPSGRRLADGQAPAWAHEQWWAIINGRYEEDCATVITTNLSGDEIAARYGQAVASRLAEMCDVILLDGADRRLGEG